ncbi:hypothetical protein NLI96_g13052 [Meripilus lineatus]|uniref:SWIM-type domain-containing protein n=1 Tax=Meripilus lineatus TaxID=2056292 RepID=A0AAD5UQI5_9APHY|nr:hypothetical protein NLI96_g13052 [Physisporinus lineatus]
MAGFALQSLLIQKEWKEEIEKKAKSHTPGQIWRYLLEETSLGKSVSDIDIPFRQKAVYYHWHVKFILEDGKDHQVKALDVLPEPGTQAMAFQVVDFIKAWAPNTQELAMDSTWNTNGAGFELFAAVASAEGSGIPLAYCLIKTSKEAQPGAKQIILTRFLTQLKAQGINPEVTLSDKDWSEINAMQEVPSPPAKPIPRVRLLINGRPPTLTPSIPKIRIPPRNSHSNHSQPVCENFNLEEELLEQPENLGDFVEEQDLSDEELFWTKGMSKNNTSENEEGPGEWWEWDDVESISDEVEDIHRLFDDRDTDPSRGVYNFESNSNSEAELEVADEDQIREPTQPSRKVPTGYQFCPPQHRLPIMRLFAKHASQHSLLPERHGQPRTAKEIYRDAVEEMYRHCETNHLRDSWAYLWNAWYSPEKWPLWARSANPTSIPTKRTTMMVEALWRNLKRLNLHMYNRPPIDLTVYTIITKSIPPYRLTLSEILATARVSRPKALTHTQAALKRAWSRLQRVPINGIYVTDISTWTCDCGAQKYHSYLLCKHLVQSAGDIPSSWWSKAVRYHIPPFYTVPIDGTTANPPEPTQGYYWVSRMPSGAGLEEFESGDAQSEAGQTEESSITSSPSKPAPTGHDGLMRTRAGGGAGFELDDQKTADYQETLRLLRLAGDIYESQLLNPDPRFVNTAQRKFSNILKWAKDVEKHQQRRSLPITNAKSTREPLPSNVIGYRHDLFLQFQSQCDDQSQQ